VRGLLLYLVQRRTGDVDVTAVNEIPLVAVEEGEEEESNVRPVHVGVRHDHHAVVAQGGWVEWLSASPQSQGRDQRLQLSVLVDL